MIPNVVIDTNVLVTALKSNKGWAYDLLRYIGCGHFQHIITVPLILEYEDVLLRKNMVPISTQEVNAVLDYICHTGTEKQVHYLWRPHLRDLGDDFVLEAAMAGQCRHIVTYNMTDFAQAASMNVTPITPKDFLHTLFASPGGPT
jgi:predicted nucleic acid-binding protein